MEKVVVKVGGAIITHREKLDFPLTIDEIIANANNYINEPVIKRLVYEIYSANNLPLIFVHGVGHFGHYLVIHQDKLSRKEIVHESCAHLNKCIANYFDEIGIKASCCAPFEKCIYEGDGRFGNVEDLFEYGKAALEENGVLTTYGDIVPTAKGVKGDFAPYQVISGDDLVGLLAEIWKAEKIIIAGDTDGLFDKDPKQSKDATLIKEIRSDDPTIFPDSTKKIDVTGGMPKKLRKLQIAAKGGIKCQIINGLKEDNLKKALLGDESIGTLIIP